MSDLPEEIIADYQESLQRHGMRMGEEILTLRRKLAQEQARSERYKTALEEIEKMRGMTLLGRCCVDKTCITDEEGTACEVRLKAHSAFGQAADVAKAALAPDGETEGK